VIELSEELVKQVAGWQRRGGHHVLVGAGSLAGGGTVSGRGEGPDPTCGGDRLFLMWRWVMQIQRPEVPGDGCGSGVGLQCACVGESGAVVTDLGEHASSGRVGQAGEADDDRVVGMLLERFGDSLAEILHTGTRGVECRQQD